MTVSIDGYWERKLVSCQLDGDVMTVDIDVCDGVDVAALLWIRGG